MNKKIQTEKNIETNWILTLKSDLFGTIESRLRNQGNGLVVVEVAAGPGQLVRIVQGNHVAGDRRWVEIVEFDGQSLITSMVDGGIKGLVIVLENYLKFFLFELWKKQNLNVAI